MASFTETVEKRNPALTATGLAVWGLVIRIVIAVSVFIVPHVVNTVSTLVEKGPAALAVAAAHPKEIATAQKLDKQTSANLALNPNDQAGQIKALSEISGLPQKDVATVATLGVQHAKALAAGLALDPATSAALLANPKDPVAGQKAVGEVVAKTKVSPAAAIVALQELATIPKDQLALAAQDGAKVKAAVADLTALGKNISKSDGALLGEAQKAAEESPKQWQHYFYIAIGGEIVFIPLIFLLTGFWSPRKARRPRMSTRRSSRPS